MKRATKQKYEKRRILTRDPLIKHCNNGVRLRETFSTPTTEVVETYGLFDVQMTELVKQSINYTYFNAFLTYL